MARADPVDVDADASFRRAARATLAVRAAELLRWRDALLAGGGEGELHAVRVATRRLRAVLEVYAPCFPTARHRRLLRLVKRTADALGAARDLDVQLAALAAYAAARPADERPGLEDLSAVLRERRRAAGEAVAPALRRLDEEGFAAQVEALARRPLDAGGEQEA